MEADEETQEETGKKRIREDEKEETETVIVKIKCVNVVSTEAFDIFIRRRFRKVVILGVTCGMILVGSLTVILGLGRVCL